jgi:hypothetical protein
LLSLVIKKEMVGTECLTNRDTGLILAGYRDGYARGSGSASEASTANNEPK